MKSIPSLAVSPTRSREGWIDVDDGSCPIVQVMDLHHTEGRMQLARLIAAAPDGYDFASRFEAAVGFMVAGLPANHAVAKDLLGLRDVARAVLAKARGE